MCIRDRYKPKAAQKFYQHRRKQCRKVSKLNIPELKDFVEEHLREDKSPEQISGIMRKEEHTLSISHETIYPVSYTHLRAHETVLDLVCRLLLEKKKKHHNTATKI